MLSSFNLLNIRHMSLQSLKQLVQACHADKWKPLIKVAIAHSLTNPQQVVKQLQSIKQHLLAFTRSSSTGLDKGFYQKMLVWVLCQLLKLNLQLENYQQCHAILSDELCPMISSLRSLRQTNFLLFEHESLYPIINYDIRSNIEFKYQTETQVLFLYLLGVIKYVSNRKDSAVSAFSKILELRRYSNSDESEVTLQAVCWLKQLDGKYIGQYQEMLKSLGKIPSDLQINDPQYFSFLKLLVNKLTVLEVNYMETGHIEALPITNAGQGMSVKLIVVYIKMVMKKKNGLTEEQVQNYQNVLKSIQKQSNTYVIRQIRKSSICQSARTCVGQIISDLFDLIHKQLESVVSEVFAQIRLHRKWARKTPNQSSIIQISPPGSPRSHKSNLSKSNFLALLTGKSRLEDSCSKPSRSYLPRDCQQAKDILKECKNGHHMHKVNLGNSDISRKFLKITATDIRWSEYKQEILDDYSSVKVKNIRGVTYGKVSKNLARKDKLEPWKCFSIITEQRSYDFYCKDRKCLFNWLAGISYHLQDYFKSSISYPLYPFYSIGRACWKMMFLQIRYVHGSKKNDRVGSRRELVRAILAFDERVLRKAK